MNPKVKVMAKDPADQVYADELELLLNHSEEFAKEVDKKMEHYRGETLGKLLYGPFWNLKDEGEE